MPDTRLATVPPPQAGKDAASIVSDAASLVEEDLDATEHRLRNLLCSEISIIPEIGGHLAFAGGKRFRPLVTLLAARACGYDGDDRLTTAAVGELLHTATLLHDDVVDGGAFRRGRPAARMSFGNGLSVLTGDFCLARALQAMAATGELGAVQSMADMVTRMAEGEVAQLNVAGDWTLDRDRYYMVIDRKTAALIAWCASVGRLVDPRWVDPLERFGIELGYAFQIADDVLDCAFDVEQTGKERGQDLREGKLTLPLLVACETDPQLRAEIRALLEKGAPLDPDTVRAVLVRAEDVGAIAAARTIAEQHVQRALDALQTLPASPAREALASVAQAVSRRSV